MRTRDGKRVTVNPYRVHEDPISDTYWLGYRHGRRIHEYAHTLVDHEPAMREELRLIGTSNRTHRAFALGELRGYRQAGFEIHGGQIRV